MSHYFSSSLSLYAIAFVFLLTSKACFATTFTLINRCTYTVWPGILSNSGSSDFGTTGFELRPHAARAFKDALGKKKGYGNVAISAEKAEELKMKEKRKREREKNLPRKKRRKLEASREMLEDDEEEEIKPLQGSQKNKKEKTGIALVDVAYRRAKAVKAAMKAVESGKIVKKSIKKPTRTQSSKSRTDEMQELFQDDMSEKRQKRTIGGGGEKKKSSFKSKSRYKRK